MKKSVGRDAYNDVCQLAANICANGYVNRMEHCRLQGKKWKTKLIIAHKTFMLPALAVSVIVFFHFRLFAQEKGTSFGRKVANQAETVWQELDRQIEKGNGQPSKADYGVESGKRLSLGLPGNASRELYKNARSVLKERKDRVFADRFSWSVLVARTITHYPSLAAARKRAEARVNRFSQVGYLDVLVSTIQDYDLGSFPPGKASKPTATERYPGAGLIELKSRLAGVAVEREELEYRLLARKRVADVKKLYVGYIYYSRLIALLTQHLTICKRVVAQSQSLFSKGRISQWHIYLAQMRVEQVEERLGRAKLRLGQTTRKLEEYAVLSPGAIQGKAVVPEIDDQKLNSLQPANQARKREEVRLLDLRLKELGLLIQLEQTRRYPKMSLETTASTSIGLQGKKITARPDFLQSAVAPFVKELEDLRSSVKKEKSRQLLTISTDIDIGLREIKIARRKLRYWRDNIVPLLQKAFDAALETYYSGKTSFLDYLEVETALLQAKIRQLEAWKQLMIASAELESAATISLWKQGGQHGKTK